MDDIKFLQFYNEIAQDNFVSIAKQNLLFQTQIRVLNEQLKVIPELEEYKNRLIKVLEENTEMKNKLDSDEIKSKQDVERHRLQTELNNEMLKNKESRDLIDLLTNTVNKQKEYIKQMKKKLPKEKNKPSVGKNEDVLLVNQNGGSF